MAVLADKDHVAPQLSHTNVVALNFLLGLEIFMSADRQLRAVHLVLDFDPISKAFQPISNAITVGNQRINLIDVSRPDFLAPYDLPLIVLLAQPNLVPFAIPLQQAPPEAAIVVEEGVAPPV